MDVSETPTPAIDDPISVLFDRCKCDEPANTKVGIFAFPAEHGREKLLFVAHGPEAEAFMQLLVQAAGPLFDAASAELDDE